MKVLFECHVPFMLAHGGLQIQIEQTRIALEGLGMEIEPLRWWQNEQPADILHFFGRMPTHLVRLAQGKGMKVVLSDLFTEQGSRPAWRRSLEGTTRRALMRAFPGTLLGPFHWDSYRSANALVALTPWEAHLMAELFGTDPGKIHVVPNGVETEFLNSQPAQRGPWLVCTATITERKRVLELAEAAVQAATPLWIIGKPYSETAPYAKLFLTLARQNPSILRYEGAINDRAALARIYREARGFVLLSAMESLSLSALEAAACKCPLLLADLPWARQFFKEGATYCAIAGVGATAAALRAFYDAAPQAPLPAMPLSWPEVARQLKSLYEAVSRPAS